MGNDKKPETRVVTYDAINGRNIKNQPQGDRPSAPKAQVAQPSPPPPLPPQSNNKET